MFISRPKSIEFAVPKFLFANICSLAKTKNQVRTPVALEADLRSQNIDICVVSETYLSTKMPHAIVNIPNYALFSTWVPVSIMYVLYRQDCKAITSGDNHYYYDYKKATTNQKPYNTPSAINARQEIIQ